MLKAKRNYPYAQPPDTQQLEYKIAPNDIISFRIFPRNGIALLDLSNSNDNMFRNMQSSVDYLVEHDGLVKLPDIGRISLQGLTIREAEKLLEEKSGAGSVLYIYTGNHLRELKNHVEFLTARLLDEKILTSGVNK